MPYFGGVIRPNWYIVHTEQWFNTDHDPSSVVFLLGQKQTLPGLSLESAYCPVHGCLSHHLRRESIIFHPVKVYRGKKAEYKLNTHSDVFSYAHILLS